MESIREYWIKNMVCRRCLKVIKQELEEINVQVLSLELGKPTVLSTSASDGQIVGQIKEALYGNGFEIAISEEEMLIEKVKIILIELTKELIQLREYALSDIAYFLNYSSVNHLSKQFKSVKVMNMTDYRSLENWRRNFYDEII